MAQLSVLFLLQREIVIYLIDGTLMEVQALMDSVELELQPRQLPMKSITTPLLIGLQKIVL
jgi:hypothetical protein